MPTYQVRLLPGDRQFLAGSGQSLLRAGLEAGFNLKYGCEGGSCGDCLARCVSGKLKPLRQSDYVLSTSQKAAGYFASCCYAAVADCAIEFEEIDRAEDLPQQQIMTRVYRLNRLQEDVMVLVLKTPRTSTLQFLAGQYAQITLENGLSRYKSIASCPCDGLKLEFHFHRQPGDPFSEYLFNHLNKHELVQIDGPMGGFTLDETSQRPLVFIALETGFASIKSQLEHVIAQERQQSMMLVWVNRSQRQPYMKNYCRSLKDALDNFDYRFLQIPTLSDEALAGAWLQAMELIPFEHSDVYLTVAAGHSALANRVFATSGENHRLRVDDIPYNH